MRIYLVTFNKRLRVNEHQPRQEYFIVTAISKKEAARTAKKSAAQTEKRNTGWVGDKNIDGWFAAERILSSAKVFKIPRQVH